MILVILGTQDKEFPRLLEAVEHEIDKGVIKDEVIVQAGQTKYNSDCMEMFDLLPAPEHCRRIASCSLKLTVKMFYIFVATVSGYILNGI